MSEGHRGGQVQKNRRGGGTGWREQEEEERRTGVVFFSPIHRRPERKETGAQQYTVKEKGIERGRRGRKAGDKRGRKERYWRLEEKDRKGGREGGREGGITM